MQLRLLTETFVDRRERLRVERGPTSRSQALEWAAAQGWQALAHRMQTEARPLAEVFLDINRFCRKLLIEHPALGGVLHDALEEQVGAWRNNKVPLLALRASARAHSRRPKDEQLRFEQWHEDLTVARDLNDGDLATCYLASYTAALIDAGRCIEALELCEQGLQSNLSVVSPRHETRLAINGAIACAMLDANAQTLRLFEWIEERHRAAALHNSVAQARNLTTLVSLVLNEQEHRQRCGAGVDFDDVRQALGRVDEALRILAESPDSKDEPYLMVVACESRARLCLLLDEPEAAQAALQTIDAVGAALPGAAAYAAFVTTLTRARVELAAGRSEAAWNALQTMPPPDEAGAARELPLLWWYVCAEVLAARGLWQQAYDAARRYADVEQGAWRRRSDALRQMMLRHSANEQSLAQQFLSHGVRGPLVASAELARTAGPDNATSVVGQMAQLADQAWRVAHRSIDYLYAVSAEPSDFQTLDLRIVTDDACEDALLLAQERGVHLVRQLDGPAWASGNARLLRRALLNVVTNAVRFTPVGGEVTVCLRLSDSSHWRISVRDQGPGFEPARALPLQLPLTASTPDIPGAPTQGLGMAFVARMASAHRTAIRIDNISPVGAEVSIRFRCEETPS